MFVVVFCYCLVGEHLSEEYEKLNPLKKVPVIDDHGFILRERYVDLSA
jgi:glutathione S-transferase